MFQIKVVQKIETHIPCRTTFIRKPCRLWDNVEKKIYGRARQATNDNTIERMRIARLITTATDTYSEYAILTLYHCNNGFMNASQRYVIRTMPVLSHFPPPPPTPRSSFHGFTKKKNLHVFLITTMHATCPSHTILIHLTTLTASGEK